MFRTQNSSSSSIRGKRTHREWEGVGGSKTTFTSLFHSQRIRNKQLLNPWGPEKESETTFGSWNRSCSERSCFGVKELIFEKDLFSFGCGSERYEASIKPVTLWVWLGRTSFEQPRVSYSSQSRQLKVDMHSVYLKIHTAKQKYISVVEHKSTNRQWPRIKEYLVTRIANTNFSQLRGAQ